MPVILSNFDAITKGQDVICEWETMQEQNSSHFIVERSNDGLHFIETGSVRAAGNSALPLHYNFTDKNILLTINDYLYYRLKMFDIDGSYKFSNIETVKLKHLSELSVYPNPVVDKVTLNFISAINEKANLVIFSSIGVKVYEQVLTINIGNNKVPVDTHSLSAGGYFIVLNGQKHYFASFIKNK